ncbi:MAG: hypothetical protein HY305_07435, partial [Sphingobacteriales bacterium]|nr:hypothetical protein [Sphingobacteriales bacterium]
MNTDTAAYFLTVNTAGGNLRFTNNNNDIANNVLSPEAYFMRRVGNSYRAGYNAGFALNYGENIYSSSFYKGEGWSDEPLYPCCPKIKNFDGLNVYTAGPANSVSLYVSAFGNGVNYTRNMQIKAFNNILFDTTIVSFNIVKKTVSNLPLSFLSNVNTVPITIAATNSTSSDPTGDQLLLAELALTYPSTFNFNNQSNFYFELQPAPAGNYVEITNFNTGGVAPVLYDMTTGNRYIGDISTVGKVKFALPGSTDAVRKFMLVSESAANIIAVNTIVTRSFINYGLAANQGNYLIISNPLLYNDGNGVDNVELYRKYRASVPGGGYTAKVASIDELTDQFAFGIKMHSAAVRDFIRYAYNQFSIRPEYVFIIGRGVNSADYARNQSNVIMASIDFVPTFGSPASDVLLSCEPGQNVPLVPIGRLSAINGTEVGNYLQKMQEYEGAELSSSQTIADKGWMKNFMHVAGGSDANEDALFTAYLNSYARIAVDTLLGANVQTFRKSSSDAVTIANGTQIQERINNGTAFIDYYGHASSSTLAYNLNTPESYQNQGKYYFFNVSGCVAGNNYTFDPARLNASYSISENFVLAKQRGSIAFLASTHLGLTNILDAYNKNFYKQFCREMYGSSVGKQLQRVLQLLAPNADYLTRCNMEENNLHGDPALKLYAPSLPDYIVEDQSVKINPAILSVADNNFTVSVNWRNIGKAINNSMRVLIQRKLPNGTIQVLYNTVMQATKYMDSASFVVAINPITDKGTNQIIVTLDADTQISELSETNNTITKSFEIFEDNLRPVFPYNYSIVNYQHVTYSSSTANPITGVRQYLMEVDTTLLFNSPFKKQYNSSGIGGLIQFTPENITYTDSTVYYWRVAIVPQISSTPVIWHAFSFVYLANSTDGFNQSHYYQHLQSSYYRINLDDKRAFNFDKLNRTLTIRTGIVAFTGSDKINVNLDFNQLEHYGCVIESLQFMVYDTATLLPWKNYNVTASNGRFGSARLCNIRDGGRYFFEFPYNDAVSRKHAMDFIDSIPDGMYISITNYGWQANNHVYIDKWKNDTTTLGSGNSLYHKLLALGFTDIDSFTSNVPFIFLTRKNDDNFISQQLVGTSPQDQLAQSFPLVSRYSSGTIQSPVFGPAKKWRSLHWRGKSVDVGVGDTVTVQVYGVKADGTQTLLATVAPATDTAIDFIDAAVYPFVQLKMQNSDSLFLTPNQLRYWRINGDYVPEGAVAPNVLFSLKDTMIQGEKASFTLAFKNISTAAFDSLKIKFVITDASNVPHVITIPKGKPLVSGDT